MPAPLTHRLAPALRRRVDIVRHRGRAVVCPLCRGRFDRFKAAWNRPDALCWRCGAHERHRAQWAAVVLREQRASPRDPRTGLAMLLAPAAGIELREHARRPPPP